MSEFDLAFLEDSGNSLRVNLTLEPRADTTTPGRISSTTIKVRHPNTTLLENLENICNELSGGNVSSVLFSDYCETENSSNTASACSSISAGVLVESSCLWESVKVTENGTLRTMNTDLKLRNSPRKSVSAPDISLSCTPPSNNDVLNQEMCINNVCTNEMQCFLDVQQDDETRDDKCNTEMLIPTTMAEAADSIPSNISLSVVVHTSTDIPVPTLPEPLEIGEIRNVQHECVDQQIVSGAKHRHRKRKKIFDGNVNTKEKKRVCSDDVNVTFSQFSAVEEQKSGDLKEKSKCIRKKRTVKMELPVTVSVNSTDVVTDRACSEIATTADLDLGPSPSYAITVALPVQSLQPVDNCETIPETGNKFSGVDTGCDVSGCAVEPTLNIPEVTPTPYSGHEDQPLNSQMTEMPALVRMAPRRKWKTNKIVGAADSAKPNCDRETKKRRTKVSRRAAVGSHHPASETEEPSVCIHSSGMTSVPTDIAHLNRSPSRVEQKQEEPSATPVSTSKTCIWACAKVDNWSISESTPGAELRKELLSSDEFSLNTADGSSAVRPVPDVLPPTTSQSSLGSSRQASDCDEGFARDVDLHHHSSLLAERLSFGGAGYPTESKSRPVVEAKENSGELSTGSHSVTSILPSSAFETKNIYGNDGQDNLEPISVSVLDSPPMRYSADTIKLPGVSILLTRVCSPSPAPSPMPGPQPPPVKSSVTFAVPLASDASCTNKRRHLKKQPATNISEQKAAKQKTPETLSHTEMSVNSRPSSVAERPRSSLLRKRKCAVVEKKTKEMPESSVVGPSSLAGKLQTCDEDQNGVVSGIEHTRDTPDVPVSNDLSKLSADSLTSSQIIVKKSKQKNHGKPKAAKTKPNSCDNAPKPVPATEQCRKKPIKEKKDPGGRRGKGKVLKIPDSSDVGKETTDATTKSTETVENVVTNPIGSESGCQTRSNHETNCLSPPPDPVLPPDDFASACVDGNADPAMPSDDFAQASVDENLESADFARASVDGNLVSPPLDFYPDSKSSDANGHATETTSCSLLSCAVDGGGSVSSPFPVGNDCDPIPGPSRCGDSTDTELDADNMQFTEIVANASSCSTSKRRRSCADNEIVQQMSLFADLESGDDITVPLFTNKSRSSQRRLRRTSIEIYRRSMEVAEEEEEFDEEPTETEPAIVDQSEPCPLLVADTDNNGAELAVRETTPAPSRAEAAIAAAAEAATMVTPAVSPAPETNTILVEDNNDVALPSNRPQRRCSGLGLPSTSRRRKLVLPSVEDIYLNRLWRAQMPKDRMWESIPEIPAPDPRTGTEKVFARKVRCAMKFEDVPNVSRLRQRRTKAIAQGWKPLTKKRLAALDGLLESKLASVENEDLVLTEENEVGTTSNS